MAFAWDNRWLGCDTIFILRQHPMAWPVYNNCLCNLCQPILFNTYNAWHCFHILRHVAPASAADRNTKINNNNNNINEYCLLFITITRDVSGRPRMETLAPKQKRKHNRPFEVAADKKYQRLRRRPKLWPVSGLFWLLTRTNTDNIINCVRSLFLVASFCSRLAWPRMCWAFVIISEESP